MELPIKLDLRNLTQEMVDQAKPYAGGCEYQTCIIGRLMTPEQRDICDGAGFVSPSGYSEDIAVLAQHGILTFEDGQFEDAFRIQAVFDDNKLGEFEELVAPWVKADPAS